MGEERETVVYVISEGTFLSELLDNNKDVGSHQ